MKKISPLQSKITILQFFFKLCLQLYYRLDFDKNSIVYDKGQYSGVAMVNAVALKLVNQTLITFYKLAEVRKESKHVFPAKF